MSIEGPAKQEGNELPYTVEKIEDFARPQVVVKHDQLIIDGNVDEKYRHVDVSGGNTGFQRNNPDLFHFNAMVGENDSDKNWAARIIDINNPDQELLTVTKGAKEGTILVNGAEWNALTGKEVYWGGYRVALDVEGKKIVFAGVGHEKQSVVVNNQEWNTKFNGIKYASSEYGTPYAIGGGKLVVNDQEWIFPTLNEEEEKKKYGSIDLVIDAAVGKNGEVAAAVETVRDGKFGEYIFIGDKQGAHSEWKEFMAFVKKMTIDEKTGHTAVFGVKDRNTKKTEIIINDIPYELPDSPEKLNYFKFEDGNLIIQYTNALGEAVAERIIINEDSKELQVLKANKENEEKALSELRKMIAQENIPISEVLDRLKKGETLDTKQNEANALNDELRDANIEKLKMQDEMAEMKRSYEKKLQAAEQEATKAKAALAKVEEVLNNLEKVSFSSSFKISSEDKNQVLNTINEAK